jgi:hypothetical protein
MAIKSLAEIVVTPAVSKCIRRWCSVVLLVRTALSGMAVFYDEYDLMVVIVFIRMFVPPLPVFRLFVSLQLREFPIGFVLSLLPGLVGTPFVVVPGMAILTVAVVVSLVGAVLILIFGLDAHGRNQGHTQQKRT